MLCVAVFGAGAYVWVKAFFINFARFHQPIFFQLRFALHCYLLPSNHNVLVQSTPACTGVNACLRVQTRLLVQSMHGLRLSGSVNLRIRVEGRSLRGGMHPRFPVDRIRGGQLKEYVGKS